MIPSRLAAGLALSASLALAQYEDLIDLPDAPTRTVEEQGIICTIEGVQINKKDGEKGARDVSIVFLLTESPSAYFNYYDDAKKAVVFDFYDTKIGESIIEAIKEAPITNSTVELFQVDLNKDVAGFKPDIRDVARVTLYTPHNFEYDVQEDVGVITMSFKWSERIAKSHVRQKRAWVWKWGLGLAVLGGAGGAAWWYLQPDDPGMTDPLGFFPPERPQR